ncbi:hypothetical protein AAEX63_00810 [Luteococcus sp. H138]|uniref:hypothetical protein n=1 Tax=unclassified Luteococcus TaxID=2639923 RepID=UPI00313DA381
MGSPDLARDELLLDIARTQGASLAIRAVTTAYADRRHPGVVASSALATGYAEPNRGVVAVQVITEIDGRRIGEPEPSLWVKDRFLQPTDDGVAALTAPATLLGTALFPLALLEGTEEVQVGDGEWSQVRITCENLVRSAGEAGDDVREALDMQGMASIDVVEAQVRQSEGLVREVHIELPMADGELDGLHRLVFDLRLDPTEPRVVDIPAADSDIRFEEFLMDLLQEE